MSGKQVGLVWELDVPARQQLVLLALADSAHHDGTSCYPGLALLAWKTGYSERNVRRVLRDLEDSGLIEPVAFVNGGRGRATEYHLHLGDGPLKQPLRNADSPSSIRPRKGGQSVNKGGQADAKRRTDQGLKADTQVSPQRENREVGTVTTHPARARAPAREAPPGGGTALPLSTVAGRKAARTQQRLGHVNDRREEAS